MSVSKWAYNPKKCDGDFCPGDCDVCSKAEEYEDEEEDDIIRGEWLVQDTSYWRATHAGDVQVNRVNLKCSRCGWRNHERKRYNYCPNCGSFNGGGEEE